MRREKLDLPPIVRLQEQLSALVDLLDDAEPPLLSEAFHAALRGIDLPLGPPRLARGMVDTLGDLSPAADQQPRLLAFVTELIRRLPESDRSAALTTWFATAGITASAPSRTQPSLSYGVIEIVRGAPPGFVARAWLCAVDNQESLDVAQL